EGIDVHVAQGAIPKLGRLHALWRVNLDLAAQAAGAPDPAQSFAGLEENSLGLLQKLYDLLLRPVSHVLASCEHLIVVPYGMLHYLPFHCLYDGTQYVVERLNISYAVFCLKKKTKTALSTQTAGDSGKGAVNGAARSDQERFAFLNADSCELAHR